MLEGGWLFPGQNPVNPLTTRQLNRVCKSAAADAEIDKRVSMHILRHNAEFRIIPSSKPKHGESRDLEYIELGIIRGYSEKPVADHRADNVPWVYLKELSSPRLFL